MTQDDRAAVLALFKEADALLQGHFKLTSGKHSEWYFEKIRLIEKPATLDKIVDRLAAKIRGDGADFDYVVSPAYGAIAVGFLTALKLGKKFAFSQRLEEKMGFRSGWAGLDGSRAVIVEDILTTGGSIREVVECLEDERGGGLRDLCACRQDSRFSRDQRETRRQPAAAQGRGLRAGRLSAVPGRGAPGQARRLRQETLTQ